MKLLAFDTSTELLSIGLYDGVRVLAEHNEPAFTRHSEVFFTALEHLLKASRMKWSQIRVVAVGLGPGSFTGLRVGLTAAKVMAMANHMKIVALDSHEIMAHNAAAFRGPVAVIADAKKGNVYGSIYQPGVKRKAIRKPAISTFEQFMIGIQRPTFFVVDEWARYASQIHEDQKQFIAGVLEKQCAFPKAWAIAELAAGRIRGEEFCTPGQLEPLYLYPRDCNVTLKSKSKKTGKHAS